MGVREQAACEEGRRGEAARRGGLEQGTERDGRAGHRTTDRSGLSPALRGSPSDGDDLASAGADGRGEPVDIPAGKSFAELGAEMMVAAQEVVDDAEELMAMFPRAEGRRVSARELTTGMRESSETRTGGGQGKRGGRREGTRVR